MFYYSPFPTNSVWVGNIGLTLSVHPYIHLCVHPQTRLLSVVDVVITPMNIRKPMFFLYFRRHCWIIKYICSQLDVFVRTFKGYGQILFELLHL